MLFLPLLLPSLALATVVLPGTTNHVRHVQEVAGVRVVATCKVLLNQCGNKTSVAIPSPCFTFACKPTGQLDLIPGQSDRQRNFLSTQKITGPANVSWVMDLAKVTPQAGFYHLGQIISGSTPAWTLDVVNQHGGQLAITKRIGGITHYATMSLSRAKENGIKVSVSMDTNAQTMTWEISDALTMDSLLKLSSTNPELSAQSYIQGGLYRQINDGLNGSPKGETSCGLVHIGGFQVSQ